MAAEEHELLTVEITSPDAQPLRFEAIEAIIPGSAGIFSVRPGHTPLLSTLCSGVLVIAAPDGKQSFFAVHDGFAEVLNDGIRILTPQFEAGEQIDAERAQQAQERAEQRLAKKHKEDDLGRAEAALLRALARLGAHRGESI